MHQVRINTRSKAAGERAAAAHAHPARRAAIEKVQQRVNELEALGTEVKEIADKTRGLKDHGYFPAMRFGKYFTFVADDEGKTLHFARHQWQWQAKAAQRELEQRIRQGSSRCGHHARGGSQALLRACRSTRWSFSRPT